MGFWRFGLPVAERQDLHCVDSRFQADHRLGSGRLGLVQLTIFSPSQIVSAEVVLNEFETRRRRFSGISSVVS